ncbi:DeoR/GlpR family DNA-binding transcription regulator [Shouchella clausii]|uniref:DeoR/GlpR family DNA-binding transcription regulator n=1 Tax=Shouchella clausii TaxID=79880 RepID=UPI00280B541A|nr:DeoR/GlpR family DNA-binding transcription regulator [Shouchella clausii]WMM33052.1 DeoR/GlpR family DNA-binding transcription regulator [Shouchella clausii]
MNPKERRLYIQKLLATAGKADIDELAKALDVSHMTVRRDLALLEAENQIIRTHGGAVLQKALVKETPYARKETKELPAKKAIAREAAQLVENGSTVLIDSGTTTLEIVKLLKDRNDLTIITNDIKIASQLIEAKPRCIITGGEVQPELGALHGPHAQELLRNIHVDLFLLGAHAVHPSAGITAPTLEKAKIKKLMMQAAAKTWLVCDSKKFDETSFARVCGLNELEGIVTDSRIQGHEMEACHENMRLAPM